MALDVPTLQIVSTAIYGDTNAGRNLTQCFIDATGTFSSTYVGNKDRLSNFTNYVHTASLISFTGSEKGKLNNVCSKTGSFTYYHDGGNSFPEVGDKVYTDDLAASPLITGYYKIGLSYINITSSNGEVTAIAPC
tara:strand:- start:2459 stop:2863 length:405 start_codon:yes stop_codon:yes gene_type:complete